MREKLRSFETYDKIVNYSSEHGFNDIKLTFAYCEENIYIMFHQKHIPNQEYKTSTEKIEYDSLYGNDDE